MDSNVSKYLKYKQKYLEQKAGMVMYGKPPMRPIHITITDHKNCDDISVTEISTELKKLLEVPDSGNPTDDIPLPELDKFLILNTETKEHFQLSTEEFDRVYDHYLYYDEILKNSFNFEREQDGIIKVTDSLYKNILTYLQESS